MSLEPAYGYRFVQSTASTTWTITHNLNTSAPVVDCWIAGEKVMPATVTATSVNVVTITFTSAVSGVALVA